MAAGAAPVLSMHELLVISAFVFVGATVQASVGVGQGLLAAPFIALWAPRYLPGPLLVCTTALVLMIALRDRRAMQLSSVGWALAGRLPGTVLGGLVVAVVAGVWLDLVAGVLILSCVLLSSSRLRLSASARNLVAAGVVSGITGTSVSVGGPPIALVLQHQEGPALRATMSGYFLVGTILSVMALASVGRFAQPEMLDAISLMPAVALGFALSFWTKDWLDRGRTQMAVLWLSGSASALLIARGLWRLLES